MKLGKIALPVLSLMLMRQAEAAPWRTLQDQIPDTTEASSSTANFGVQIRSSVDVTFGQILSPLPDAIAPESTLETSTDTASRTKPKLQNPASKHKNTTAHKSARHSRPRRRVVKEAGAEETAVQLSEGMPGEVAMHRRASTTKLLSSTEDNLKRISNRQLTVTQQATVDQIRLFIQQSRDAIHQSDVDRAHTLALKAHLLSDSLMKP
jgi:hypothetical protein